MPREAWPGGYIHRQKNGEMLFIIEKQVGAERFHISTRCHNWTSAMKQLERFQADPLAYSPAGTPQKVALVLTEGLVREFQAWQTALGNTRKYVNHNGHRLADWIEDLNGVDLRKVNVHEHLKPVLERRGTSRQHRIIAIKVFYKWLRVEKGLLRHGEDPTLDLPVPKGRPEKYKRRKAVPLKTVRAVLSKLPAVYADVLLVLGNTGMHITELYRFIRDEESQIRYGKRGKTIAAIVVWHKKKKFHPYAITDLAALRAAERLRERREAPRRMNEALAAACAAAEVPGFTFGVMRHSVATWLKERTGDNAQGRELLGHESEDTTDIYADVDIPKMARAVPALRLLKNA